MKHIKYTLAAAILCVSGSAKAQNLNSAYFMDGFTYGHELNPAQEYDRDSYFSVPFLTGNLNVGLKGNLQLKDIFLQNPNGNGLATYLHPDISYDKAMSGFSSNNKLITDLRWDLLSFGFHAFKGYNTVTVGIRTNVGMNIPYELFSLTKKLENRDYNFSNLGVDATAWAEVALGHSHQVNEAWRVGGKAKILIGGAYARMKMDNLDMNLQDANRWTLATKANMEVGVKGFTWGEPERKEYKSRPGEYYEQIDFDNMDVESPGIGGMGFALDLGAEWDLGKQDLLDGMKVSASILDLGFIKWKNVATASNNGDDFIFEGFNNIQVEDGPGTSMDDQIDELGDKLEDLYRLQDGGSTSKARMLGATLNLAVEYALPMYKKLKFGFLSSTRIQGVYSWNEERIGATVSPCKWFEASANLGVGTVGTSMGWVINLHPRGFSLFLGMDHLLGKLSKQFIPLNSHANISMGINYPLGKSRK